MKPVTIKITRKQLNDRIKQYKQDHKDLLFENDWIVGFSAADNEIYPITKNCERLKGYTETLK